MCKYPLLLRELIKSTAPDHPDMPDLVAGMERINNTVSAINDQRRQYENRESMRKISTMMDVTGVEMGIIPCVAPGTVLNVLGSESNLAYAPLEPPGSGDITPYSDETSHLVIPTRRFVMEVACTEIQPNKQRKDRSILVFNDMLMVVKEKKAKTVTYKYSYHIPMLNTVVFDVEATNDLTSVYTPRATPHLLLECDASTPADSCIEVVHPNYMRSGGALSNVHHLFLFSSAAERQNVIKAIKTVIKEMIERREARDAQSRG